eukprot:7501508-Pyramimonas_sp.AAC.1
MGYHPRAGGFPPGVIKCVGGSSQLAPSYVFARLVSHVLNARPYRSVFGPAHVAGGQDRRERCGD